MQTLEIQNLTKKYQDKVVVDQFNAVIEKNELVTIVGPSGCGKTTTLRMIAGFIEPTMGTISVDDIQFVNTAKRHFLPPEKRKIGMVFQSYAVWPHMNVFKNVSYPLKLRKMNKTDMVKKTREVLKLVHLEQYENNFVHELSGGQQQRVALARALVMEPRLLLLDEPLSNLDAALREKMRAEIKEIQRKLEITVINVTHDQIEAMTMSDRVIIMNAGRMEQVGSPSEIYNHPVNSFVAKFIGSANVLPCQFIHEDGENMTVECCETPIIIKSSSRNQDDGFLAVRPHHIAYDPASPLKAKVTNKLYQGDRTEYHLSVGNHTARMISDEMVDCNIGDRIGVRINRGIWLND